MRTFNRFLSVFTVFAVMSGTAAVSAAAQTTPPDDQQYDQSQPDTTLPEAQPAPDPMPNYEEAPADQPTAPSADESASVNQPNQGTVDPPGRAARLQYMTGSVSVQPQGTGDWVAGELNRPLTNSDNIWADKNSRAELSVGAGLIRLGSESSLTLTDVSENAVQLQLHQGALYLHVRRLYDDEKYEVDTPNQAFAVEKPGDYRFDVDPDADKTIITVWSGEGESTGDGQPVEIRANEQVRFTNGTSLTAERHAAPGPDAFDEWAQSRDNKFDHSQSARYVSPDTVGSDDLDEYGAWKETPDYGPVWYPAVAPGWAPYYYGHWVWENPWGWTWVDYEPWGFAPFHYGRWVYWGGGWGWAPGPVYVRPYYAPALVAWFGGGVGVGFGWCPLGWGEPFIPWYHTSFGYFRGVNITNTRITNVHITNIYNNTYVNGRYGVRNAYQIHYANMNHPGGFTAVSRTTLVNSLSVAHNNLRVAPNQMSRMNPVHSLGVGPTRASIMGSRGIRATVPPSRAFSRPVVSRMAPARAGFNNSARAGFNGNMARPDRAGISNNMARPGANARPGAMGGASRPAIGNSGRGPVFNNSRPAAPGAMGARSVPRPPMAGNFGARGMNGMSSGGGMNGRYSAPQISQRSNVPHPPSATMGRSEPSFSRGAAPAYSPRSGGSMSSVPRGGASAPSAPRGGFSMPSAPRSGGPRGAMNVPRPSSPPYMANNRGSDSYGRSSQSYGGGYGRSASRSYGRGSMGSYSQPSSRPSPSYGGGAYSRPSGNYGGSMNSHAYGNYGGGHSSAPAYGGGFGGRSSGGFGGGRSYGGGGFGGGGHASSGGFGGGGGHVGGGAGGGHFGGGGHGGRR